MPNLGQDKEKLKKIDFLFLVPHFLPRNKKFKKTKKQEFLALVAVATHTKDTVACRVPTWYFLTLLPPFLPGFLVKKFLKNLLYEAKKEIILRVLAH